MFARAQLDADEIVRVLTTSDLILMEMVRSALDAENIPALLKSVAGYHIRGMLPFGQDFFDYRLSVPKTFEMRAREIIETIVPAEDIK